MSIEDLAKEIGLSAEQGSKLKEFVSKNFMSKEKFNEINEAKKGLETTIGERDKQLNELKKANAGNADLQKTIDELQSQNKNQKAEYDKNITNLKLDNALNSALTGAKAKNNAAVKAMLGLKDMTLGEDGKIKGLDEAIGKAKEANPWAFEEVKQDIKGAPPANGYKPAEGGEPAGGSGAGTLSLEQQIANGINGKI